MTSVSVLVLRKVTSSRRQKGSGVRLGRNGSCTRRTRRGSAETSNARPRVHIGFNFPTYDRRHIYGTVPPPLPPVMVMVICRRYN